MNIEIRKASLSDLSLLMEIRMRVLREVFAGSTGVDWELLKTRNAMYYQQNIPAGTHTACLALQKETGIVGCGGICYQQEMPSPDNPRGTCGYHMNIFTVPEMRGRGIGRKIVNFLIGDAKKRGTDKIFLESSKMAKSLYEDIGFEPMIDYLKLC